MHSVWKATCHWIDYAKSSEKFDNLALHMDLLALECSLSLAKFKKQAENRLETGQEIDLDFERRDLVNFLQKSARIDEKLGEGLKDVPKHIKKEVDVQIAKFKSKNGVIERDEEGNLTIVAEEEAIAKVQHLINKGELPGAIVGTVNVAADL